MASFFTLAICLLTYSRRDGHLPVSKMFVYSLLPAGNQKGMEGGSNFVSLANLRMLEGRYIRTRAHTHTHMHT